MIIHRAFYREATGATLAIVLVLLGILVFATLTVLLGRAVQGENAGAVLQLLGYQTLRRLDLLLPFSLYLGILLTLSRWYRDSEMAVLAACGIGLPQLLRPVLVLAVLFSTAIAAASFYLSPLANRQIEKIKDEGARRPSLIGIAPGVFSEFPSRGLIVYTEHVEPDSGVLRQVFINRFHQNEKSVVLADSGTPMTDPKSGDKFLVLRNGAVYQGVPGRPGYRILEFAKYLVRLEPKRTVEPDLNVDGMPTLALWRRADRYANSEWHWRLSKPIIALVLPLFAVALAYTDARRGRMSNLFASVLVYITYSNVLALGQTALKKGQVAGSLGLWWVHLAFAGVALYLIARRTRNEPLRVWFRRAGAHR